MDWRDGILLDKKYGLWETLFGFSSKRYLDRKLYPEGSVLFKRRKRRKFRTRYIVCKTDAGGQLHATNTEIRYRKSRKAWGVFFNGAPVRHYLSLKAAKLALMPGVLDRMGAEGHRCLDHPCSAPSSKKGD